MTSKKSKEATKSASSSVISNGDRDAIWKVKGETKTEVKGLGSFHKSLPHNDFGEVCAKEFKTLVAATRTMNGAGFESVEPGKSPGYVLESCPPGTGLPLPNPEETAKFTNPRAGLAKDRLTPTPGEFNMPPAPPVFSEATSAEMAELYWMALARDVSFTEFGADKTIAAAASDLNKRFKAVQGAIPTTLQPGKDLPGSFDGSTKINKRNVFRLGLPGEEEGPLVSQFFIRDIVYGTQEISQKVRPYRTGRNYLTNFEDWLHAQRTGNGNDGLSYSKSNEACEFYYEGGEKIRHISTMRDLARFVNKDALHQAYFNAALIMLNGGAKWTPGNPYVDDAPLSPREAGFGTLGGPHILALVSEVATRALKIVWNQKWQTHLRLRPEAFGGIVQVSEFGNAAGEKREYDPGLPGPAWAKSAVGKKIIKLSGESGNPDSLLLPMAFTPGGPTHPAYGAGHATVAGACVTVLKAYFKILDGDDKPIPLVGKNESLTEKAYPYSPRRKFKAYETGVDCDGNGFRRGLSDSAAEELTIEGELNKLASNVSMGRSMGGVHWRTDNSRSLILGEAIAAHILADISADLKECPEFVFRTFVRTASGDPKIVRIGSGKIIVDDEDVTPSKGKALSML